MTGTIARLQLEKGFGFIKDSAGQDYFFHRSAVVGEGMENLREGDSVSAPLARARKGRARRASVEHRPNHSKQSTRKRPGAHLLCAPGLSKRPHPCGGSFTPSMTRR